MPEEQDTADKANLSKAAEPKITFEKKSKLKEFFAVDWKDIWNWVLLAVAIALLYWGTTTIIRNLLRK